MKSQNNKRKEVITALTSKEKVEISDIIEKMMKMGPVGIAIMNSNANVLLAAEEMRKAQKTNGDTVKTG